MADRTARILTLWEEGRTVREIARALGCERRAVLAVVNAQAEPPALTRARRRKVRLPRDRVMALAYVEGLPLIDICALYDCDHKEIYKALRRRGIASRRLPRGGETEGAA